MLLNIKQLRILHFFSAFIFIFFMSSLASTLTYLRNAQQVGKRSVTLPFSILSWRLCTLLVTHGYLLGLIRQGSSMVIFLKYYQTKGAINQIILVSKPSKRVYTTVLNIPSFYKGLGLVVLSTTSGILSHVQATQSKLGGEVLCTIW